MQIDKLRGKELDQLFNSILSLKDPRNVTGSSMIFAQLTKFNRWLSVLKWRACFAKETRIIRLKQKQVLPRLRFPV